LLLPDQQCETSANSDSAHANWQDRLEALDSAQGDYVRLPGKCLRATAIYSDIRKRKSTNQFPQEDCFFLVGLDQGEVDLRPENLDGQTGKAGTRTYVDDSGGGGLDIWEEVPRGEQ
jgi:hypothetical protein